MCAWINLKIAIKRELGLLWSSLLDHTYQSSSISKAPPPCNDKPTSACSTLTGTKSISAISEHASKGCLSGKLRPLSLPKPTIILPFSHSKTMTILKDGHMKPVPLVHTHTQNKVNQCTPPYYHTLIRHMVHFFLRFV